MKLVFKPIPEKDKFGRPLFKYDVERAERLRSDFQDPARSYEKDGVLHWVSNDAVVPLDVFEDAYVEPPAGQRAARDAEVDAFCAEYRRQRANHRPSEEEMFEMRAAFGPGQEVVDVITGQKFRT